MGSLRCERWRSQLDRSGARRPPARAVSPAAAAAVACALFAVIPARLLAADPPTARAPAAARAVAGNPVQSVFFISKSENRNQVHYGVRVDARCRPDGARPVYGYWRDFEDGPTATSRLLDHEQSAYGLTAPRWVRPEGYGGQIRIGLRGFPDRPLTIETFRAESGCRARAHTTIARFPAVLRSIYVELGFLFSIDYVLVRGYSAADGRPLQEKVND
jgi:hypothetical protein